VLFETLIPPLPLLIHFLQPCHLLFVVPDAVIEVAEGSPTPLHLTVPLAPQLRYQHVVVDVLCLLQHQFVLQLRYHVRSLLVVPLHAAPLSL
jgi:hypothetical protein